MAGKTKFLLKPKNVPLVQWDVSTHFLVRSKSTKQQVDPLDYFISCRQTFVFFLPGPAWAETD